MTTTQKIRYLSATQLHIGYKQKSREACVARTPELEICSGDFICLLGPNGAGKSTLIRTLAGIQTPLEGTVQLDNHPLDQLSPRERARKVSVVLTEMTSPGMLDAHSLVALGRHPYSGRFGILGQKDRERIAWAFQAVDAISLENRQVTQLSDGERQKLLIARALAQETPLMLLDEPTAFLDLPRQIELMLTLRKLAGQEQMGILLSTHNLDLALRFADRIWLLREDGTILPGYPEELVVNGEISHTFSSKEAKWQIERGAFSVQANPELRAMVQGNDSLTMWTRHALERLGFTIVEDLGNSSSILIVKINQMKQQTKWLVDYKGLKKHFDSIGSFINWVSSPENTL